MLKVALSILLAVAAALTWWLPSQNRAPACSEPIAYAIGTFDRRFEISQEEFLDALAEAEAVWEPASGRDLFAYSPEEAKIPVNLIYDYRQEATKELLELEGEVEENETTYRALETRLENMKNDYESEKSLYEARVAALESRNAAYESQIERWNSGPRTSKKEFGALEAERMAINEEVDNLRAIEAGLNRKVTEINSLVDRLNRIARSLNLNVEEYNKVGASRGETFAGGIYYSDAEGEGINIYEFESREKLVRILAHELGHALGLDHIEDPEAIMYRLNEGEAAVVTPSDLAALKELCKTN